MKKNEVFVIDIAMLPTLDEQAFVVGDVMKTINEMVLSWTCKYTR